MSKIDVDRVRAEADLVAVVGHYVQLRKDGKEFKGCCPFHSEKTPSFYVSPEKGFVHCFGCGVHDDVIGFVQRIEMCDFREACEKLGHRDLGEARVAPTEPAPELPDVKWVPLLPVPADAPDLLTDSGWTVPIWNAKRAKFSRFRPARTFDYRNADGELLGYVLRCEFGDGKITPTVTWCIRPDGAMQWVIWPFPRPRPLYGLDALAAHPASPVLVVEGEKCRAAGAGAFGAYVVVAWPGGGKGVKYVDWTPLAGRDVTLWPDADPQGQATMLGVEHYDGRREPGIAQFLFRAGVRSVRYVDTSGQPKGWDIADALDPARDGWSARQLATWAAHRVVDVDVVRQ